MFVTENMVMAGLRPLCLRAGSRGSVDGGGGGAPTSQDFFLKRMSEPCERENFARKEIVFMLPDAFLEIV